MKTINYISWECFVDTDIPILPELRKYFDIRWILFFDNVSFRASEKEIQTFCSKYNIPYTIFRYYSRRSHPWNFVRILNILRSVKIDKSDIIYIESFHDPYFPFLARIILGNKNVVIGIHDFKQHKESGSWGFILLNWCAIKMFHYFHFFSESQKAIFQIAWPQKEVFLAKMCLKDFGDPTLTLIHNIDEIRKKTFLFFGTIRANKGLEYLIAAGNRLWLERKDFQIKIAGRCNDISRYAKLVKHSETFDFDIRDIPNHEVPDLFNKALFLVLPYKDVTQSGPLHIAYRYNLPVIASNFAGFREYVIDGKTGFLMEPENESAVYSKLKIALDMSISEYKMMKNKLDIFVKVQFNIDNIIMGYRNGFDKVLQRKL